MSRRTSRRSGRLPEFVAAGVVVVVGVVVTVVALAVLGVIAAVLSLSGTAAGWLLALVAGGGVFVTALGAWLMYVAVARTRRSVEDRLSDAQLKSYERVKRIESAVPFAPSLGLESVLRPDDETVLAELKRRYVEDELDEHGFERAVERLLDETVDASGLLTGSDDDTGERSRSVPVEDRNVEERTREGRTSKTPAGERTVERE